MIKQYAEVVEIKELNNFDVLGVSGDVIFDIKGMRLSAFVTDFKLNGPFFIGEKCRVILSLLTTEVDIIKESIKKIENGERYSDYCILHGEIIDLINIDKSHVDGITDCGILVHVGLPLNKIKIGEFINANGRLDIIKIK